MNVLLNLKKWGIPVIETVIDTIYIDGNVSSHFHPVRDSLIVFAQLIKHTAASLTCTLLDWILYLSLINFTPIHPEWAYLSARFVSTTVNYQISRRLVFRAKPSWRTTLAYYMLALSMASTGSMLVMIFTRLNRSPHMEWIIKLPVDTALFFAGFFLQKNVIFADSEDNPGDGKNAGGKNAGEKKANGKKKSGEKKNRKGKSADTENPADSGNGKKTDGE